MAGHTRQVGLVVARYAYAVALACIYRGASGRVYHPVAYLGLAGGLRHVFGIARYAQSHLRPLRQVKVGRRHAVAVLVEQLYRGHRHALRVVLRQHLYQEVLGHGDVVYRRVFGFQIVVKFECHPVFAGFERKAAIGPGIRGHKLHYPWSRRQALRHHVHQIGIGHHVGLAFQTARPVQHHLQLASCLASAQVRYVQLDARHLTAVFIGRLQYFGSTREQQMGLVVVLDQGHFAIVYNHRHAVAVDHGGPVAPLVGGGVYPAASQRAQIVCAVARAVYLAEVYSPPVVVVTVRPVIGRPCLRGGDAEDVQTGAVLVKEADAQLAGIGAVLILRQIASAYAFELRRYIRRGGKPLTHLELQSFIVVYREHYGFGLEWLYGAVVGVYQQRYLLLIVAAVAVVSSASRRSRVDVKVAVVQTSPSPVDMHQTVLVIAVIHKGMVSTGHKQWTPQRQFVVYDLQKLSAGEQVFLELAHSAVIVVLQRVPCLRH